MLIDFQELSPLGSRTAHPYMQEIKKGNRSLAWMNKELLSKLKHEKEMYEVETGTDNWGRI